MPEAIALVCKTCGGEFVFPEDALIIDCPACGTAHQRPRATGDALADLRRAHQQRAACDFVNAAENYQRALNVQPDEAEALWGLALCKYGVEYILDDKTNKTMPIIHFLNRKPFTEDLDCRLAIDRADAAIRAQYKRDAEYIVRIQQGVLTAENHGVACDVFLCYKGSVPGAPGSGTREFSHAQHLYMALRDAGYSVFFAHMTLRRVAGANYEAQIFHALQSAKVMLVITSDPAYLNTPWVHSEWSRFLERIDAGEGCRLIPLLYDDCDPCAIPDAFSKRSIQALNMGTLTALDDLRKVLDSCIPGRTSGSATKEETPAHQTAAAETAALLRRAFLYLEDGDWAHADSYCERVLDKEPECARAYLGKLMASLRVTHLEKLRDLPQRFDGDPNYRKAVRFADPALATKLQGIIAHITQRNENAVKQATYQNAEHILASARAERDFFNAQQMFASLGNYLDAPARARQCSEAARQHAERAETERKDSVYHSAVSQMGYGTIANLQEAVRLFSTIATWKDSEQRIRICQQQIGDLHRQAAAQREHDLQQEQIRQKKARRARRIGLSTAALCIVIAAVLLINFVVIPNRKYDAAVALMNAGHYEAAIAGFAELDGYKDSAAQIERCNIAILDGKYDAAVSLMNSRRYEDAIAAFQKLNGYRDSETQILECRYRQADSYLAAGERGRAAIAFGKLGDYRDAGERNWETWAQIRETCATLPITAGDYSTIGIFADGSVHVLSNNTFGEKNTSSWTDIVAVAGGNHHTVGLRKDGTVVTTISGSSYGDVSDWYDIVAISAGLHHTVGLRTDGTVIAVGDNDHGECNTAHWSDIVAISAGSVHTVALHSDGTVVAIGRNDDGQCNVSGWSNIVAISAGGYYTVGLRSDGTVVATGKNDDSQCNVSGWSDIVAISAGSHHTVALRSDSTVVAVGDNFHNECDVSDWSDIVAISAGDLHTIGLRSDGTVVAVGDNIHGQCDVSGWTLRVPD